ncbi:MAG TPA: hypothetical protein VGD77_02845 [Gemmatimonadaceae bacterium]
MIAAQLLAALLSGATPDTLVASDTLPTIRCEGQVVRAIEVDTRRPPFKGQMAVWRRIARSVGLHHATTRESIVRRFVTLGVGGPCTEFRRAESERLLRALPYLARASVRAVADSGGGVRVLVQTVDEVPATGGVRFHGRTPEALSVGSENVLGVGLTLEAGIERGRGTLRDGWSLEFAHYQLFGRPYRLVAEQVREPAADRWEARASHPFLTDLQRIAWIAGARERFDYLPLAREAGEWLSLGVRRNAWDVGGVLRVSSAGAAWLAGGAVSGEKSVPDRRPSWVMDTAIVPAPYEMLDTTGNDRYDRFRALRIGPVVGVRRLAFTQARGLDALAATQDLARGVQLAMMLQRGVARRGADGWLAAADLFAGMGGPRSYAALQLEGEGRRARAENRWEGVIAGGRAAWYLQPAPAWTTVLSLEGAGGRLMRYPLLLDLGHREGGLRGLATDTLLGSSRAVARLEQRWYAGPVRGRGDLGFALFADAGRTWAGGNALAVTTPVVMTAGVSILAATPVGAQRTARLDIGTGVRNAGHGWQVRLSVQDYTRAFWRDPGDLSRVRASRGVLDVLSWP